MTNDERVARMASRLQRWGAKLDSLGAGVEAEGEAASAPHRDRLEALRLQHRVVQTQLNALQAASSDDWEAFWIGLDDAWRGLVMDFKALESTSAIRRP